MPKNNALYPDRLDFWVSREARLNVIKIGYLIGSKGRHAKAARLLLNMGIKQYLDGLTPRQRADFEFISKNVDIAEDPKTLGGLVDSDD